MRKYWLIFLLIIVSLATKAQNFNAMLIAGMNASQVNGDSLIGFNKVGLQIGAGIETKFSDKTGIRFEFLYSQKGSSSVNDSANIAKEPFRLRLNYVEVPVYIYFEASKKLNVEAGASLGLLLNAKFSNSFDFTDQTDAYFRTDYTIGGGVGYQIIERLSGNIRSSVSVVNVAKRLNNSLGYYNLVTSITLRFRL